ncbi:unnamed protein product [Aphanomyces euteiches]
MPSNLGPPIAAPKPDEVHASETTEVQDGGTGTRSKFGVGDDVKLLIMASWEEIASALKIMPGFQLKTKTGPVLKSRFEAIMTRFSQGEVESMRKSGSNEDYQERQQLMTDIQSRIEDYAQVKEVRRDAEKRKSEGIENSGTLIRKLAMAELASSKESDQSDSPCKKKRKCRR